MRERGPRRAPTCATAGCGWLPAAAALLIALAVALGGLVSCRPAADSLTLVAAILPGELPVYRDVLGRFERDTGRSVIVIPQQYSEIRRALAAEAHGGSGSIDVAEMDVYYLSLTASYASALDWQPRQLQPFSPAALRAGNLGGVQRFLPQRLNWQALIYDHEALGDPPATWDDLLRVARAHPGQIAFKGAPYEGLTCDVLPFVWMAGGRADRLDTPEAATAFRFLQQLAPYLHPATASFKEASILEAFARRELVAEINWPFAMAVLHKEGLAPGRCRSAPLPAGPKGRATVLGGGYLAVPRTAPHPHAAQELVHYLLSAEVQRQLGSRLGWVSARDDAAPEVSPEIATLYSGFEAMRPYIHARPDGAAYPAISRAWQEAFRRIVLGGEPVEKTLRELARQLDGKA